MASPAGLAASVCVTAESLAIIDTDASQANDVIESISSNAAGLETLAAAEGGFSQAAGSLSQIEVLLHSTPGDPELVAARDEALLAVEAALGQLAAARANIRTACVEDAPANAQEQLEVLAQNSRWMVPPAFRVLQLEPEQWTQVELALRAEQRATRSGGELSPFFAELLSEIRAHPDVALATANLQANLIQIEAEIYP